MISYQAPDFTVPLFAKYLRENHPLAGFDDE
jgi:hypothetical protein